MLSLSGGGKFSKSGETNLGPGAIRQVHTFEALSASLAVVLFVVRIGVDPVTRVVNKLSSSKIPKLTIGFIGITSFRRLVTCNSCPES